MTLVAIHQPTFLPWLGWWDKLVRADVFVLLDDVQFPNSGRSWMNRVRVLVGGEPHWITMPIARLGLRIVRETHSDDRKPWRDQILTVLERAYAEELFFDEVFPIIAELVQTPTNRVNEYNEITVRGIAEHLGLDASTFVRQSELGAGGSATDLLVNLTLAVGGTSYLSGDGADDYLEPEKFPAAGLGLEFQNFNPPPYTQRAPNYVPGLSIVDALMSCGWQGTAELLKPDRLP